MRGAPVSLGGEPMTRAARALVAAEHDAAALRRLMGDLDALAASVPFALASLLRQLTAHSSPRVRRAVAQALPRLATARPAEVAATLWRLAQDESRRVRQAARRAIAAGGLH